MVTKHDELMYELKMIREALEKINEQGIIVTLKR